MRRHPRLCGKDREYWSDALGVCRIELHYDSTQMLLRDGMLGTRHNVIQMLFEIEHSIGPRVGIFLLEIVHSTDPQEEIVLLEIVHPTNPGEEIVPFAVVHSTDSRQGIALFDVVLSSGSRVQIFDIMYKFNAQYLGIKFSSRKRGTLSTLYEHKV